jgi:hypothetical protein
MGLFALLARVFPSFSRKDAPRFAAAPLAPRRLERRRVFDGAAAGLVLEALPSPEPYVQTSEPLVATQESTQQPLVAAAASSLQATIRLRSAELFEDQSVLATIEIVDSPPMAHQITIDWGDGSLQVINVGPSVREALAVHRYLDDNPTGTASDVYTVKATVTNPLGGSATSSTTILVKNVAPKIDSLTITPSINENDNVVLSGTYSDPGTLDTHSLDIDWDGDGTYDQTVAVTGGTFSVPRQVLDDNPTGTASDVFNVNVRLRDDDGGSATRSTNFVVNNLNPQILSVTVTSPITENGFATLTGTYNDTGTQDTHELDIDWDGDGNYDETVTVTGGSFAVNRQYLDDPAGINDSITINVRLRDDDGGSALAATTVTVENADPVVLLNPLLAIDENGTAVLSGTYSDAGTQDIHELDIDWDGDNIFDQTVVVTGGAFTVTRQFLDDNPTGTPSDIFNVNVRLRDDDGGEDTKATVLTVNNKDPELSNVTITPSIDENGTATLSGTYTDVGTQDTHELDIDWDADGNYDETVTVSGGSFSVSRQFLDDNPTATPSDTFNVNVRLRDDDGGVATDSKSLTINNQNPSVTLVPPAAIEENQSATLQGTIADIGTLDTFTLTINWGDPASPNNVQTFNLGTTPLTVAADGINWDPLTRTFSLTHQYLDDNPSGTPDDLYTINVTATDDDLGVGTAQTTVLVKNVGFTVVLQPVSPIDENRFAELQGTINDPGTRDTFELEINWGDPASPDNIQTFNLGDTPLTQATDGIDWDPLMRTFTVSRQYLDDNPTATGSDTYAINIKLTGDDLSTDMATTSVVVRNIAPQLTFQPVTPIDENGTAVLEGYVSDPGTRDTFMIVIDWQDPLSPNNIQIFTLGNTVLTEAVDGINWDPTTRVFSLSHQYLDDNPTGSDGDSYPVTVEIVDDDTGFGSGIASIEVRNVDPVVLLDPVAQIDEGGTATLTGSFTDVGLLDTHTVYIDWGDGKTTVLNNVGANGVGSFTATHTYADNDTDSVIDPFKPKDNLYTITVKVVDDDQGTHAPTTLVKVLNVVPSLDPVIATDVTPQGFTTLTLSFQDPGADSFQIMVDWGDKLHLPPQDRFVLERVYAGPTPNTFVLTHQYSGPPNPANPSADIVISVVIRDDDFNVAGVVDNGSGGSSDVESIAISNPGIGGEPFRIDTTPQVPQLTFPPRIDPEAPLDNSTTNLVAQQNVELRSASGETQATADRYIELRVIDAEGHEGPGYRLRPEVLQDLPGLFRKLPDNHYAVYVVNMETNTRRLVIEVYVRNGKLIDPGDDSEGTRDRPPTDEQMIQPPAAEPSDSADAGPQAAIPNFEIDGSRRLPAWPRNAARWSAIAAGLAASASSQTWVNRVDQAMAQATAQQWRKLQGHNPPKPKNQ